MRIKNITKTVSALIAMLFIISTSTFGHDEHKSKKVSNTMQVQAEAQHEDHDHGSHENGDGGSEMQIGQEAQLSDFPSLHPLIVHFAIVLILIGAALQLLNLFLRKKEVGLIAFGITAFGLLAAYLAANSYHPHTAELSTQAQWALDQHDVWAERTQILAGLGVILQALDLFVLKQKKWPIYSATVILILAAFSVSRAGHYGSQLVHIEGVGPQGNFLETDDGHDHTH